MGLRVLTYNIHGLPWICCPIESILLWICYDAKPDIICFQEVFQCSLKQKLSELAPRYGYTVHFAPREPDCFGRSYLGFQVPCGLCILTKDTLDILGPPKFTTYQAKAGLDSLVNKGYLSLRLLVDGREVLIVNTHLQADFDEIPCYPVSYERIRDEQERELFLGFRAIDAPILLCGDFNQSQFQWFHRADPVHTPTFPSTGGHIDHLLFLHRDRSRVHLQAVKYYTQVELSDHIPILYQIGWI
jgi:endonuclease/exonuclease/phosphatase family metal-dependent hydrolase